MVCEGAGSTRAYIDTMVKSTKDKLKTLNILRLLPPMAKIQSFLATENLQNHFFSKSLVSNFSFWWNFASKKNKVEKPLPANALEN
jgi:hypothetical protein